MKQILDDSTIFNQNPSRKKNNNFAILLHHLKILNTIQSNWQNLKITQKLPKNGYRLVSIRPHTGGYKLTIFAANSGVESKFHNYLPSLLTELSKFSITRVVIKIRNFV